MLPASRWTKSWVSSLTRGAWLITFAVTWLAAAPRPGSAQSPIVGIWVQEGVNSPIELVFEKMPNGGLYVRPNGGGTDPEILKLPVFDISLENIAVSNVDDGLEITLSKDIALELYGKLFLDVVRADSPLGVYGTGPVWSRARGDHGSTGGSLGLNISKKFDPASKNLKKLDNVDVRVWGDLWDFDAAIVDKNDLVGEKSVKDGGKVSLNMDPGDEARGALTLESGHGTATVNFKVTAKPRASVAGAETALGVWPSAGSDIRWSRGDWTLEISQGDATSARVTLYTSNNSKSFRFKQAPEQPASGGAFSGDIAGSTLGGSLYYYEKPIQVWRGVLSPVVIMGANGLVTDYAPDPSRSSAGNTYYKGTDGTSLRISSGGKLSVGGVVLTDTPTPKPPPAPGAAMVGVANAIREGNRAEVEEALAPGGDASVDSVTSAGETAVHLASKADSPELLAMILDMGGDANRPNAQGMTGLQLAVKAGKLDNVRTLLTHGAKGSVADASGNTPLHSAALLPGAPGYELLAAMLETPDAFSADGQNGFLRRNLAGETPVMIAARLGDLQKLEAFARADAPINDDVATWAVKSRKVEAVEFVIQRGITSDKAVSMAITENVQPVFTALLQTRGSELTTTTDLFGQAAQFKRDGMLAPLAQLPTFDKDRGLDLALAAGSPGYLPAVQAASDAGANPTRVLRYAVSVANLPLAQKAISNQAEADSVLTDAVTANNLPIVKALMPAVTEVPPAAVSAAGKLRSLPILRELIAKPGTDPAPALPFALEAADSLMTAAILDSPVKVDVTAPALMESAIKSKSISIVTKMLDKGASADVGLKGAVESNQTALATLCATRGASDFNHVNAASKHGNLPLVSLLVAHGGSPQPGMLPACERGRLDIVQFLLTSGATGTDPWYLRGAGAAGSAPVIQALLAAGADGKDPQALRYAILSKSTPAVATLLAAGPDVNARTPEIKRPLLMDAVASQNAEVVKLLLGANADFKVGDGSTTPLHLAVSLDNDEVVRALIEKGPPLEVKDTQGQTPLHVAVRNKGRAAFTQYLIDAGADVNAMGPDNKLPLQRAKGSAIKKILKAHGAAKNAKSLGKDDDED